MFKRRETGLEFIECILSDVLGYKTVRKTFFVVLGHTQQGSGLIPDSAQ